jgi:UPF0755 protein
MKMIIGALSLFIVSVAAALIFFGSQFLFSGPATDSTEILFDVLPGQAMTSVASNLESKQLIKNAWLFSKYCRFLGMNTKLKKGEYSLNRSMTPNQVLSVITSGKSVMRSLTIPEGKNIFDIADILEKNGYGPKADFLKLVKDSEFIQNLLGEKLESLEGYLFPNTYKVTKFDTQKEIAQQMVTHFLNVYKTIAPEAEKLNWSRNKLVTFASIVEKETGHSEDRNKVSSVFHNRLKLNMRLQTDPTVLYGKALMLGEMPNNISRADLQTPNKYNTYTNYGLPPTPISNPGRDALLASINPENTKYIYFVSRNDGTTAFSETLIQHNEAVKKFQQTAQNREGKSWKDLNKAKDKTEK